MKEPLEDPPVEIVSSPVAQDSLPTCAPCASLVISALLFDIFLSVIQSDTVS